MDMITGSQLRKARERRGWKQEDLAQQLGVTLRTIGNWERGTGVPANREEQVTDLLRGYLAEPGQQGNPLADYSNLALISEVLRRLDRADTEGGQHDDRQSEAEKTPLSTQDEMTQAAHRGRSHGKLVDEAYGRLGEESQDPGGMDPA